MIEIDGSQGEGGGQMLRTALALSALTGKEFRITRIRANRQNPGLAAQHLTSVSGVAELCGAEVEGAKAGSMDLRFKPGPVVGGMHQLDVGTAGSVTLVLQACLLALARCRKEVVLQIRGGTNVGWSPPVDHYQLVLLPLLCQMGGEVRMEVARRGFYPEGGGEVLVTASPWKHIAPFKVEERGMLRSIDGVCFSRNLPPNICQRMADVVRKRFKGMEPHIHMDIGQGPSAGAGVFLCALFERTILGGDALGERGISSERVGEKAVDALLSEINSRSTLDVHTADQLLPYMALANGESRFLVREITGHLSTQIELVRRFLDVRVELADDGEDHLVSVSPSCT